MDERLERHLCNLHNEVFEAAESRINTECSLIICEGISMWEKFGADTMQFPHYMWGYIAIFQDRFWEWPVPSLYVRVYRQSDSNALRPVSSLIICEGISEKTAAKSRLYVFPHYMWGYIVLYHRLHCLHHVPSLYVRVYRFGVHPHQIYQCSLIICEGISSWTA